MNCAFWAALHDGTIDSADGCVPGAVRLVVSLDYICRELGAQAETLVVVLHGCTVFSYAPYDEPAIQDLAKIASMGVEMLYAADKGELIEVDCNEGTLRISYDQMGIRLSGGRELVSGDVVAAATRYWDRFRDRATHR